jgi:hypothetical protein
MRVLWVATLAAAGTFAQEQTAPPVNPAGPQGTAEANPAAVAIPPDLQPPGGNRVFGVLPNYRTADASQEGTVLTSREKLAIAAKDSFDYPLLGLAGALAALGQWTNQQPSFGQEFGGYAHRVATNYADQSLGNMFTEGVFPVLLHEDPRYFRRGTGSTVSRVRYALTRVLVTRTDSGGTRFNYSEWLGNASAVGISNFYYPDSFSVTGTVTKLLMQVGTDAASQVMKELWPDIKRKMLSKGSN